MAESGGSGGGGGGGFGTGPGPERASSMADKNGALKCTFSAPSHSTSLLQGLAALRSQGQLLDIVLTVNRETFHAHKVVLAACSDYFRCCRWWSCVRSSSKPP
ncbi:kelch like family member 26 [Rhinolophus ferrumequinum]|uniref:Kelch like family member 26 n=1 Tax=Rhinolophus ferrumequinum TaxID=59479 RepID=A0A7J7U0N8_RHIFE|nr:kelch like family member 26 [Rhinolophus ferrumequinum]